MLAIRRYGRSFFSKAIPFTWTLALAVGALLLALLPALAHAQAVDAVPNTAPDLVTTVSAALDHISKHEWWPLLSLGLSLAVWAVRDGLLAKIPGAVGQFLGSHPMVGWSLPFVLSGAMGWATSMGSGHPWTTSELVSNVIKIASGAIAAYMGVQKTRELMGKPVDAAPAQAAGVAAAADPGKTLGQ